MIIACRSFPELLSNDEGETLVETLVSILIGVIALMMLATAVTSAGYVVTISKDKMEDLYEAESLSVEKFQSNSPTSTTGMGADSPYFVSTVPLTSQEGKTFRVKVYSVTKYPGPDGAQIDPIDRVTIFGY